MVSCSGEWLLLVSAGQVYDDPIGVRIERWLRSSEIHPSVSSLGWPRFRFVGGELTEIVTFEDPETMRTFAVRDVPGLHFVGDDLHTGWRDADGRCIGIDHVVEHPSVVTCGFGVHDYASIFEAGQDDSGRTTFDRGQPEVFWRYNLRDEMTQPDFVDPSRLETQPAHLAKPVVLDSRPPS